MLGSGHRNAEAAEGWTPPGLAEGLTTSNNNSDGGSYQLLSLSCPPIWQSTECFPILPHTGLLLALGEVWSGGKGGW